MIAYVTGADRGLGAGLVEKLLSRGFEVFAGKYGITDMFLDELSKTYGEALHTFNLDVSSDTSVTEAAAFIKDRTEHIDILFNNAGIRGDFSLTLSDGLDFEDMKRTYNVNTLGPLRVTQSVFDLILKGKLKKIVNISSEAGSIHKAMNVSRKTRYGYCMSKCALNIQSVFIQNHGKEYGIKVYAMEPGWVRSYMSGVKNLNGELEPEESADQILKTVLAEEQPEYLYMDLYGKKFEW